MKRKKTSADQLQAKAQPSAETRYRIASTRRLSRRPYFSPGIPANIEPKMVPRIALKTVTPSRYGVRW